MRFDIKSFVVFVIIFLVEVLTALFVDDKLIRPYGGDFLVVIMIYFFLKSFIKTKYTYLLLSVLTLAYAIEIGQLFNLVEALGMQDNKLMSTVLGTSFSWGDLVAYTLGVGCCFGYELLVDKLQVNA